MPHSALALGFALMALQGCAGGPTGAQRPMTRAPERTPAAPAPEFSPDERARIAAVDAHVRAAAARNALEPDLVRAVIWVESRFDPRAQSSAGARGLMQLMPATANELAQRMGRPRPRSFDPEFNVSAGSYYLARLLERYDGDVRWALAAYHAGPGNADRWRRDGKLPDSSERYVQRVLAARARFRGHDEPTHAPAVAAPPPPLVARASTPHGAPRHAALAKLPGVALRPRLALGEPRQPADLADSDSAVDTAGVGVPEASAPAASLDPNDPTHEPQLTDASTAAPPDLAAPSAAPDAGATGGLVTDADAPASQWSGQPLPSLPTGP